MTDSKIWDDQEMRCSWCGQVINDDSCYVGWGDSEEIEYVYCCIQCKDEHRAQRWREE